jgi:hypothetical protein
MEICGNEESIMSKDTKILGEDEHTELEKKEAFKKKLRKYSGKTKPGDFE